MNLDYINKYGLLNAKKEDIVAENSPLFSVQYLHLSPDIFLASSLEEFIDACATPIDGLYNQTLHAFSNEHDLYMSPDQLIAFISFMYMNKNQDEIKKIWKYLWTHLFTYDNISASINFKRIMQPKAVLYTAILADSWIKFLAKPALSLAMFLSCYTKPDQTSGKLKVWTMLETYSMPLTQRVCEWILNKWCKFKNWKGCFLEYFKEEEQPIHVMLSDS